MGPWPAVARKRLNWSMDEMVDHEEDLQDLVEECGWLVVEVHVDSVSM